MLSANTEDAPVLIQTRVDRAVARELDRLAAEDRRTRSQWLALHLEHVVETASRGTAA